MKILAAIYLSIVLIMALFFGKIWWDHRKEEQDGKKD